MIGLVLYPVRNVIRDLYYIVPTVLWAVIGYIYQQKTMQKNRKKFSTYMGH